MALRQTGKSSDAVPRRRRSLAQEVDLQVGHRIREARIAKGLSQEELGAIVGLSYQQLQKYERGANRVSVSTLVQLAKVLELRPSTFLDGLELQTPEQEEASQMRTRRLLALARSMERLPPSIADQTVTLVKALADNCGTEKAA
jgi:transcriptional regulator with XRE-family HTH domain